MKQGSIKKYLQKGISVLLAAVLAISLAGCGGAENQNSNAEAAKGTTKENDTDVTARGRYMETQLETPQYFQGSGTMTLMSDGSVMLIDWVNGIKSISRDNGMSWESETVEEIKTLASNENVEAGGAAAPDGGLFIHYIDWSESTEEKLFPEKYIYLAADGSRQEFDLGLDEYHTSIGNSAFSADGRLFTADPYSGKIYEIDLQEQNARELFTLQMNDLLLCVGSTQLMVQDGSSVYFYDLDSGEVSSEDELLNDFIEEQSSKRSRIVMCPGTGEGEQEALYLASIGGIYRHVIGGSVMEQLADGALNNLGDPTRTPVSMVQPEEGTFLILYDNGELYSYVYDAEASAVPEEQITVYSLYDNETVRRAISVFRKEYPDVFVKFEIGLSGEDGMTENDAIRNLNTRILSDGGPDLLLLNGMPMDSYVEKGILADLGDKVEEWKKETNFYEGILEGYRQESGLYVLPFRYDIPLIGGAEEYLSSIRDLNTLADVAERIADSTQAKTTVLNTYTAEELLERLYAICEGAWVTENNTVDEQALQEFLTDAKRIYNAEQKNLTADKKEEYDELISNALNYCSEPELKKAMMGIDRVTDGQMMGSNVLAAGYLYSMQDFRAFVSEREKVAEKTDNYQLQIWNGQSQKVFCPTGIVGLCANAQNPEYAEKFIETLLSEDVQREDLGDGFPVNRDAFKIFSQDPNPNYSYSLGVMSEDGEYIDLNLRWANDAEIEELNQLISSLHTPAETNSLIKDSVISIGVKALTGEKEIDESVEEIVQKISLQLQE